MNDKQNVIILPQAVDYYQVELTNMLENEQYLEATELLDFLLNCHPVDPFTYAEWQALLEWLETMLPELVLSAREPAELTEQQMMKQHLREKTEQNQEYVQQLLGMLNAGQGIEQQILALEQLTYIEHESIDEALIHWLTEREMHPFIQFKGLQALKHRDVKLTLHIPRNGKLLELELDEVPLNLNELPAHIVDIMNRVQSHTEVKDPELYQFAVQIWEQFIAYIYGTVMYRQLIHQGGTATDAWAAALHVTLLQLLYQDVETEEIYEQYGITTELVVMYEQAYTVIQHFLKQMMPFHS